MCHSERSEESPAGEYRNPTSLPDGAILVIGSGQSGCQIAEELYQNGRKVYLSVGSAGRLPRRYRGKDAFWWLNETGFFNQTPDKLPSPKARFAGNPQVSGAGGGHSLNLHQFARDGVTLLGRVQSAHDHKSALAPNLKELLSKNDEIETNLLKMIDDFIEETGADAPREEVPKLRDGYNTEVITELDLKTAGIGTIIWAMGYKWDFSLVKLPVFCAQENRPCSSAWARTRRMWRRTLLRGSNGRARDCSHRRIWRG